MTPDEILKLARAEKPRDPYVPVVNYAPSFVELQRKGFSWVDIHKWALEHGLPWSKQSIFNAARSYATKHGIVLRGYETDMPGKKRGSSQ